MTVSNLFYDGDDRMIRTVRPRPSTPEHRCRAVRAVASLSLDVGDCAELLDMLGLEAREGAL